MKTENDNYFVFLFSLNCMEMKNNETGMNKPRNLLH